MIEETTRLLYLLSGTTLFLALVAFYVGRSLWIARREWRHCSTDTKVLYLLVAPALTLAVDILELTDRLFWSRKANARDVRSKPLLADARLRPKPVLRSDG